MLKFLNYLRILFISVILVSCAATEPWHSEEKENWESNNSQTGAELDYRMILIGDMGDPVLEGEDPVLSMLQTKLWDGDKSSVIFLGNNVLDGGMPAEQSQKRELAEEKLAKIFSALGNYRGNIFFTAGNHDWKPGIEGLRAQRDFILNFPSADKVEYLPGSGCPGPETVEMADNVVLIMIDSEWFLQRDKEQIAQDSNCKNRSIQDVASELKEIVDNNIDKHLVLAAHHPFETRSKHGGYFTWKEHFFPLTDVHKSLYLPLPVVGSFYPVLRNMGISNQDLSSARYDDYDDAVLDVLEGHPSVITVAGHDHALQYFEVDGIHHIVSGSGSKTTIARKGGVADFVFSGKGFATLDFYNDGSTWLEMWTSEEDFKIDNPVYRTLIHSETKLLDESGQEKEIVLPDSTEVITDAQYETGGFGKTILGEHYRKSWTMPVNYPVLNLREEKGGLNINSMGGGFQTTTFFMESEGGRQFVLRSIPKDPTETLPKVLQRTFIRDLIQDQISASNPFGPSIVAPIADAAGIYYTVPEIYYLPDDPALGKFRDEGKEQPVLLEEFIGVPLIEEKFGDSATGIADTEELMELLLEKPNHKIDARWFLKTRLVDMVLGDWDRHEGQFFWASMEDENGSVEYRAFPLDRDNVIFKMDGVLPWIANRKWALRQFQHFDHDIRDIAGMNFQAQHLDRRALAELGKEYWILVAKDLKNNISDEAIEEGVKNLPEPVFELRGEGIISKLKSRRDKAVEFAERYYEYVAKELEVVGTKGEDLFIIDETGNDNLILRIYSGGTENSKNLYFERLLNPDETKEVRLYGISGNDRFLFRHSRKLPIKFHLVGGEGESELTFANAGVNTSKNIELHSKNIKGAYLKDIKPNMGEFTAQGMEKYGYNYQEYAFDFIAPALAFSFNQDDGIFLGGGFTLTKYGFRKYPYAAKHRFTANVATAKLSYNFLYEGEFIHLIGNTDLLLDIAVQSPNFQANFFGLGNETTREGDDRFHDVRKDLYSLNPILRYRLFQNSEFRFGPTFEIVDVRETDGKFISTPQAGLADSDFATFKILGFKSSYEFDTVDNKNYPKKGFNFEAGGHFTHNFDDDNPLLNLDLSVSGYHTIKNTEITLASRLGVERNFGDFRFFQANTLGDAGVFFQSNTGVFDKANFRGVLRDRFSGKSIFYQNTEVRSKLLEINSYFVPGSLGFLTLFDHGRVWIPNENSSTWHYAVGGGLWYNFFDRVVVSATYGNSDVDDAFSVVLGFLF